MSTIPSLLMRVRPAPVAVFLKRVLRIHRRPVACKYGQFWIDPVSNFGIQIQQSGAYEPELTDTIHKLITPECTFIDIGANEGFYSVVAAKLGARVIAVEPQQRLQPVIARNLELNGVSATVLPYALSDAEGTAEMHIAPDTNTGSSGIFRTTSYRVPTQKTRTTTLSTMLDECGIHAADVVKMDIEGFEYEAVLGSKDVFKERRIKAFCLELHPQFLKRRNKPESDITAFLSSCGYVLDTRFRNTVYISPS